MGVEAVLGGIGFVFCLVRLDLGLIVHELVVVREIGNGEFNLNSKFISSLW